MSPRVFIVSNGGNYLRWHNQQQLVKRYEELKKIALTLNLCDRFERLFYSMLKYNLELLFSRPFLLLFCTFKFKLYTVNWINWSSKNCAANVEQKVHIFITTKKYLSFQTAEITFCDKWQFGIYVINMAAPRAKKSRTEIRDRESEPRNGMSYKLA